MYILETEVDNPGQRSVCVQFSFAPDLGPQKRMVEFLLLIEVRIENSLLTQHTDLP